MASASPAWKAAGQRCSTFATCLRDRLRAFNTIARSSPWIILGVPFLTFLVLATAGIIAVALSARGAAQHSRDEALSLARAAASQYGQQLAFASSAVEVLAAVVSANPSYDRASSRFNTTAPALLDTAPTGSISSLHVLPSGRLRLVYPTTEAVSDMLGFDALADTGPAMGDTYSEDLAFVGPLPPMPGREAEGPLLLVRRAIFVPLPADLSNNFGRPDLPNPSCGDLCAYNQTRGTVFWGLVVCEVLVRALDSSSAAASQQSHPQPLLPTALATPAVSALRALGGVGYAYRLTAGNGVVVTGSGDEAPREPVTASLALPGSEWQLQVWHQSGSWKPGWFGGALAAAILLAAAAALLLCRMLVSRRRHAMLLEALLPRDLLKELSATHAETMGRAGPLDAAASPAGLLLELLGSLLAGSPPDLRQVVLLRSLVLRQADWYHPLGVAQAIKGAQLESDVARALMRQLGTGSGTDSVSSRPDFWKADGEDVGVNDGDGDYDGVESDPMERRQRGSAAGGGRAGGGWQGAGGGGVGGVDSDAGDPAQQQQQEQLGTLRGALAFVLSPAAHALPLPLAAAGRAGPLHLGSNSDRAAAATAGAASSSTGRRRRRRSSLLGLQAGGGGSAGPGMAPLQQPSAPLMSAAAMQAISAADIDAVTLDLASAAVELLETTEDLELAASGALRSYPVLMPPVGPPGLLQQPSQPQQLQSQAAPGTPALLLQSCDSMSFAGLVLHRTDSSQQQQQARRGGLGSGWRPKPAASASSYHHVLGGFGDAGSAASAGSSSQLVMNAATAILVGRQQAPHSAASNSGSPRAQPALPRQPQQPQQAQQARRAQTPTYPSLLPPPPAASAQSPVPSGAAAGPAASAGSRLLHSLQQHRVARQPQQDAPQHASATIAGGNTAHLTATSAGRAAAVQDVAAPAADGGGSDRACQGGVDAACEAHRRPQQHAGHCDPRTGEEDGSNHSRAARRSSNRRHGSEAAAAASMRRFTAREEGEEEVEAAAMDGLLEEGEATRCAAGVHRTAASSRAVAGGAIVPPPAALLDQVEVLLAGSGEWQYDTWTLAEASGGHALSVMGFYLMQREGLVAAFRIQPVKLARLLRALEDGYPADNPYHNATHAADVLRTLSVLLRGARLTAHYAHGLGLLASYFAAIIHDHGHPGLTGDFLVATSHPLALRYNDRSPLESHHAASAFTLLAERPDLDAFAELPKEQRTAFRKQVVDMVLATDMKQHFSLLTQFTALHKARKAGLNGDGGGHGANGKGLTPPATTAGGGGTTSNDSSTQRQQQQQGPQQTLRSPAAAMRAGGAITSAASNVAPAADPPAASNTSSSLQQQASQPPASLEPAPSPQDDAERSLTLQIALKAADIGHLAAALPVHCRWLGVLEEEFFRQGDKEKELGIPISPLFDRAKQGVSKSQVGFFDFVALPLVRALTDGFPGASPLAACFERNYTHWKTVEAEAAAQQAAAQQAAAQQPRQRGE